MGGLRPREEKRGGLGKTQEKEKIKGNKDSEINRTGQDHRHSHAHFNSAGSPTIFSHHSARFYFFSPIPPFLSLPHLSFSSTTAIILIILLYHYIYI